MAQRHNHFSVGSNNTVRPSPFAVSLAALTCLAGTTGSLAQSTGGAGAGAKAGTHKSKPPMAASQPAQAAAPEGSAPAMRDPMGGTPKNAAADQTKVKVDSDNMLVDLHVNDEDLINILQMLSMQSQKSILTSKSVSATVTANLYNVTFYDALDAILHINGFGYIEKGNFIYVYTLDELESIAQAQRARVHKTIRLTYLNAIDAAEFVKPLLSEGGQIKTNGKTPDFQINDNKPGGGEDYTLGATMEVVDFQENIDEIQKVVAELDIKPAQVLVEATVLQTTLNESNAFGVDFSILAGDFSFGDFTGAGGPLKAIDGLISGKGKSVGAGAGDVPITKGRGLASTPGNTAGPADIKLGIVQGDVAAFLRALDEVTDTTVISNPKILALNRMPSRVLVGRKVGYLSTTSTDTATTQTVQFLDTGTQLYFRPFVSPDGTIRMELKPQVSTAVIRDAKDSTGSSVTIPDQDTNEIVTNVMVRDGQTVVLGGLFRDSTQAAKRQVPFLGDVPIIGAAFRGHDDTIERTEVIFMITPTIINDQILIAQGDRAKSSLERIRTGSREGLLPFSRDKMTGMMNVEAERLAADGKTSKAIWKLQQSLNMNPAQPEARALLERLSGERSIWPSRSMLEEILHAEVASKAKGSAHNTPGNGAGQPLADQSQQASVPLTGGHNQPSPRDDTSTVASAQPMPGEDAEMQEPIFPTGEGFSPQNQNQTQPESNPAAPENAARESANPEGAQPAGMTDADQNPSDPTAAPTDNQMNSEQPAPAAEGDEPADPSTSGAQATPANPAKQQDAKTQAANTNPGNPASGAYNASGRKGYANHANPSTTTGANGDRPILAKINRDFTPATTAGEATNPVFQMADQDPSDLSYGLNFSFFWVNYRWPGFPIFGADLPTITTQVPADDAEPNK
jgi:type IV pilus assembly protein PilQ